MALKLVELTSDENCLVIELSASIGKDPSLAVRLLVELTRTASFGTKVYDNFHSGKRGTTLKS